MLVLLVSIFALVAIWLLLRGGVGTERADVVTPDGVAREAGDPAEATHGDAAPTLVGASEAGSSVEAQGTVGDVVVEVVGRGDARLPGFPLLLLDEDGNVVDRPQTDADGRAVLRGLPYDGSHVVRGLRQGTRFHEDSELMLSDAKAVTGPHVLLRTNLGVPCEIHFMDVDSGSRLEGIAWGLLPRHWAIEGLTPVRRAGRRWIAAAPDANLTLRLVVDVPQGYVAWANRDPYVQISRYATALRHVYPLHREADVVIDVLEHDGSPARDPCVVGWSLAGREDEELFGDHGGERLALNRIRLRGVPFVADARLRVRVGLESLEDDRTVEVAARLARPTRLVAHLPHPDEYEAPTEPIPMPGESTIGLGGSADEHPPLPPEGRIDLVATQRDGQTASRAGVSFGYREEGYALRGFRETLDEQGRLRRDVPEGTWFVSFHEPGLVQTGATIEVRAGETATLRLREGRGGTVRLRVIDPAGRPLPFARFRVNDWMWRDLEGGVQRLDPYVDVNGTRTLRHVSPGDRELSAWYAGGTATESVTVLEGVTVEVTVGVEPAE